MNRYGENKVQGAERQLGPHRQNLIVLGFDVALTFCEGILQTDLKTNIQYSSLNRPFRQRICLQWFLQMLELTSASVAPWWVFAFYFGGEKSWGHLICFVGQLYEMSEIKALQQPIKEFLMRSKSLSEAVSLSDPVPFPAEGCSSPGATFPLLRGKRRFLSVCRGGAGTERMIPPFLKEKWG